MHWIIDLDAHCIDRVRILCGLYFLWFHKHNLQDIDSPPHGGVSCYKEICESNVCTAKFLEFSREALILPRCRSDATHLPSATDASTADLGHPGTEEWTVLWLTEQKVPLPATPPTARWARLALARLWGFTDTKRTGRPG